MEPVTSFEGTTWRTSSYSGGDNACVEVALDTAVVGVRDSKAPEAGALLIEPLAWHAFVRVATH